MAVSPEFQDMAKMMVDALGLPKNTRSFELRMAIGEAVTVKCEYFPDMLKEDIETILFKYDLVKK